MATKIGKWKRVYESRNDIESYTVRALVNHNHPRNSTYHAWKILHIIPELSE